MCCSHPDTFFGFGTPLGVIRNRGEHRQCVRGPSQIRGMVRIGRDRGQHPPQLPCGAGQIGAPDLFSRTRHRTPTVVVPAPSITTRPADREPGVIRFADYR